ncbi:MAG: YggS family pyridoxal phosphate-dependent enzyme [Betaproteobacteria bacterium]|nr:YggS family pyridoxal phosphate-dependent enzyme [Betaproteobacteria bacterium]
MATIAANLQAVRARIGRAAQAAGRRVDEIKLLAVSKTFPAARVREAYAAGQHAFGESYAQEAVEKITELASIPIDCRGAQVSRENDRARGDAPIPSSGVASPTLTPSLSPKGREEAFASLLPLGQGSGMGELGPLLLPLEWHFIGPIQSNKTRVIAEHFQWVHSVEREKIAIRLSDARPADLPPLDVCIQVNVSGEHDKRGIGPGGEVQLAEAISRLPRLRLRGLMAIPEPTPDTVVQRRQFALLRELQEKLVARGYVLDTLSMGMSDDLEAAIMEGATIVRVGTAIFGPRNR